MTTMAKDPVLSEALGPERGAGLRIKQALLVAFGIAALIVAAKIRVPMWPVPITLQTLVVLLIGATYGLRLGVGTIVGYLALGALGINVFTSSNAESHGLAYMAGPTGGYLVGFAMAAAAMGMLARRGWDRTVTGMVGAMLVGTALIYAFGLAWMAYLFAAEQGMAWVLQVGMLNFLVGDALKLAIAALLVPALWRAARRG